jgi:hypothetical protein
MVDVDVQRAREHLEYCRNELMRKKARLNRLKDVAVEAENQNRAIDDCNNEHNNTFLLQKADRAKDDVAQSEATLISNQKAVNAAIPVLEREQDREAQSVPLPGMDWIGLFYFVDLINR